MKGVQGQWGLEVIANGRDLNLDDSLLANFQIISNIHQHLPSVSFTFKDINGEGLDNLMVDGDQLNISIGLPGDMYNGMQFRVMGMPTIRPGGSMSNIMVQGVLDKIGWMKKVVDKAYTGNSSNVISQIAGEAGLRADTDGTNDSMIWLPNRTTLVQYARHVAERSFSSATSAMILATTDTGKVRFKDLDKLISGGVSQQFSSNGKGLPILDYVATPKSQVANAAQGYGATSVGMNEDGSIFEGNKIQMTMMSAANSISSSFQSAIGDMGARINAMSPLSGNTHMNWFKALHQNPRIKASYAFDIALLTNIPTRLELLDTVDFNPINYGNGKEAKALVGKYIVTAITKTIVQNRFFEKVVITAQGAGGIG